MYPSIRDAMISGGEFETPVQGLRHLAIEAVEVCLGNDLSVPSLESPDSFVIGDATEAAAYRTHLDTLAVRCSSLLTARDLSTGDRAEHIAWLTLAVGIGDALGCESIRIDSVLSREKELSYRERVDIFCSVLGAVLDATGSSRVALAIENHGMYGNSLGFLLNVLEELDDERAGLTLDTANFYWRGYPLGEVYGMLKLLAPYARHTHVKNIAYPEDKREISRDIGWEYEKFMCPLDEGDIDHGHVLRMLAGAGYRGDVCIENEALSRYAPGIERIEVLERDAAYVRELIASIGQREPSG